ncbi:MAG: flagellar FliJ family protein [Deltaproteobacteria bacterium]|nr:flagellar FliJ family protein [Deltaproteobacteria bacterium]
MPGQEKRLRRLQRLSELIRRKLDQAVAALAQAQRAQQEARDALASVTQQFHDAIEEASTALGNGAHAEQWRIRHAWQETLRTRVQAASALLEARGGEVVEARTRVLVANEDLQKLNALIQRVRACQQLEDNRLERRAEDATYAALAALSCKQAAS